MKRKYFGIKDEAPTSNVIDLPTRRSGMDAFMDYNDMVRTIRTKGIEYAKKHDPLLKKFNQLIRSIEDGRKQRNQRSNHGYD